MHWTGFDPSLKGTVYAGLAHAADWGITLASALGIAGSSEVKSDEPPLDGLDLWPALTTGAPSPRTEMLLSMRDADQCGAAFMDCMFRGELAFRKGRYKLLYGHTGLRGRQGNTCTWSSSVGQTAAALNCWNGWGRPRDIGPSKPPVPLPPRAGQPPNSSVYDWCVTQASTQSLWRLSSKP